MIPFVESLEEAKQWFLKNPEGHVVCLCAICEKERIVMTYLDALKFYESPCPGGH